VKIFLISIIYALTCFGLQRPSSEGHLYINTVGGKKKKTQSATNTYRITSKNSLLENDKAAHVGPPSREIIRGTTQRCLVYEFQ
jgi:hypothetical protein